KNLNQKISVANWAGYSTLTIPVINFKLLREKLGILDKSIDILEHVENATTKEEKQRRKQVVEDFEDEGDRLLKLQPNLHKLFYFLKKNNLKRALLTRNKQSAVDTFVHKFIQNDERNLFNNENEIFLNTLTRDFKPVKPHPAPIQHICKQWGVPCENVLMVGDDVQDIQSGNAAGAVTVRKVKADTQNVKWNEDIAINDLSELIDLLDKSFDVRKNDED
uniref:Uncharacterized protein n=1 Tax=Clytia hemisphaerica TaxID=252671 RepID=A0A7M5UYT1_9CNID